MPDSSPEERTGFRSSQLQLEGVGIEAPEARPKADRVRILEELRGVELRLLGLERSLDRIEAGVTVLRKRLAPEPPAGGVQ